MLCVCEWAMIKIVTIPTYPSSLTYARFVTTDASCSVLKSLNILRKSGNDAMPFFESIFFEKTNNVIQYTSMLTAMDFDFNRLQQYLYQISSYHILQKLRRVFYREGDRDACRPI
jgi:predicted alpha/beta-fold hydrolase